MKSLIALLAAVGLSPCAFGQETVPHPASKELAIEMTASFGKEHKKEGMDAAPIIVTLQLSGAIDKTVRVTRSPTYFDHDASDPPLPNLAYFNPSRARYKNTVAVYSFYYLGFYEVYEIRREGKTLAVYQRNAVEDETAKSPCGPRIKVAEFPLTSDVHIVTKHSEETRDDTVCE